MCRIRKESIGSLRSSAALPRNSRISRLYRFPHTGESLTFAELDARAENIAAAISPFLTGPDQVVAVAMSQDNWQIVASHLGVLKAGGTLMFLDTTLPDALITHMLNDAQPVRRSHAGARPIPRPADARCLDVAGGHDAKEPADAGWTIPHSALRPSSTRAEPLECRRAWSARTQVT